MNPSRQPGLLLAVTIVGGILLAFGRQHSCQAKPDNHPAGHLGGGEEQRKMAELATDIKSSSMKVRSTAIKSLYHMCQANEGKDMTVFSPTVEPLVSMIGWGGIARRESEMAAETLRMIGKPALPALLAATKAPDARLRWASAEILTTMRPMEPTPVSILIPLISDRDPYVRRVSIECLGRLGKDAKEAAPSLQRAMNDSVPGNRLFCHRTLIQITGEADPHVAQIALYLRDSEPENRQLAATLLGDCGPSAKSSWRDLLHCMKDADAQVRINATAALGAIGIRSDEVVSGLIESLESDKEIEARRAAAASLGKIGPAARKAVPVLAKILQEADRQSKGETTGWWVAAEALGGIGGEDALQVLTKTLKNKDPDIRIAAARSIERIRIGRTKEEVNQVKP